MILKFPIEPVVYEWALYNTSIFNVKLTLAILYLIFSLLLFVSTTKVGNRARFILKIIRRKRKTDAPSSPDYFQEGLIPFLHSHPEENAHLGGRRRTLSLFCYLLLPFFCRRCKNLSAKKAT